MTEAEKIAVVGCGNMGASLIGGLIADGYPAAALFGVEPDAGQRRKVQTQFGIRAGADLATGVADAAAVIMAVKPERLPAALAALRDAVRSSLKAEPTAVAPLVLSVVAGVRVATISKALDGLCPVARAMPNTPALVRAGATALFAPPDGPRPVTTAQRALATRIMQSVGVALWLKDESLLDAATAVSGSGPAYFFLIIELLENIGVDLGLEREQARALTVETALGAARMLKETGADAATLRRQVTSPGGTTEKALQAFQDGGLEALLRRALGACHARSVELARAAE